jgi:lysophospholipase L1-like esterase
VLALVVTLLVGLVAPASAGTGTGPGHRTGYYLALGDSLAAGYQPGRGDDKDGGYVGTVHQAVSRVARGTRLVNLACSGETVVTLVDGGRCPYDEGSQLAAAQAFLAEHGRSTKLITIDIGGNDVLRCVLPVPDQVCAANGIRDIATRLPGVLATLRELAPHARLVVLNYYNSVLGAYVLGDAGQAIAAASVPVHAALNDAIAAAARANGALLADVATAFRTDVTRPTRLPTVGTVPANVATVCLLTWMCRQTDIHANTAGYTVMAATVLVRLALPARVPAAA